MTIDVNALTENNSWAFVEARKALEKIDGKTPKKGYALFETGYGPSGLPHIGTFGEVVRTSFVRYAFSRLAPDIPTKLICVSDDMDGIRKVPSNIPNQDMVAKHLGKPLTAIPDPFEKCESYGEYMNSKLQSFLDRFEFDYEFVSASDCYKSGKFDEMMLKVVENYEKILDVMLPTLGAERQQTYSPFMPICQKSGKVLEKGVKGVDKIKGTVIYTDLEGEEAETPVTGGNCKLQWKPDFGARWYALDVDYEMYGKDHAASEDIYRGICKALGGTPPVNFTYEMFLDENGAKLSKSKGNGVSVDEWLNYAPQESLSLYMYQKPKTAKKLYFEAIPKAMDEYLTFLKKYPEQDAKEKLENPVFYIHEGDTPRAESSLSFSLLLNLASACNPEDESILWGFIEKYQKGLNPENSPMLDEMAKCAVRYYNDFIKPNKEYRQANEQEKKALKDLRKALSTMLDREGDVTAEEAQNAIYEIGKKHEFDNMRDWFLALYEILLGQKQGPRMGSFIVLYGLKNMIAMIDEKL